MCTSQTTINFPASVHLVRVAELYYPDFFVEIQVKDESLAIKLNKDDVN